LALAAVMVRLDEPTVLVRQGEIGETFFLVVEGEMEVAAQNAVGQEQVPARLGPGDHYGEIALLFDQPRTTTVRTLGAARLMVLERERFYTILRTAPVLRGRLETVARARLDAERMK
ncbi:MAG: cyclic nucleotide-binding domain-containing protein, partial [Chloroflexi bacterium]|nr:cyclic nucleotide-binding domain-containing protein [Chloroflexota bacterium]